MSIVTGFRSINIDHQERILLMGGLVNPKREMGKDGIRNHTPFTRFFHNTIKVDSIDNDTKQKRTLYLNKNSAIQWIEAQTKDCVISTSRSDGEIIARLNAVASKEIDWNDHKDFHTGHPSTMPIRPLFDRIVGSLLDGYWMAALSSWTLFRARFKVASEKMRDYASQVKANFIYDKTMREVPAYRTFLNGAHPATFGEVPVMNKENYIKKFKKLDTMAGGQLPRAGQIDTSTGTSGKPTMWVRGTEERMAVKTLLNFAATVIVKNKPLFFINAFALGPWATGITTAGAMVDRAITFNPGPEADKILDFLQEFPPSEHPDRVYVIAGYPPFMKLLLEKAAERKIDLSQYPIKAVIGGEACSDLLRASLTRSEEKPQGFEEVYSSYGASDLDINIGYESPFEWQLRKACRENPKMAAELYGPNEPVPMIFHYDPMNYYVETNQNQELIYTCVRDDRCSPRVRYNLKDRGKVLPSSDVRSILKKYGVEIVPPNTNLPLLFIWGREGTVNYRGAKVPHEHLQEAIEKVPGLQGKIKNYAFNTYEGEKGKPVVEFWLEFKEGEVAPVESLEEKLIDELKKINQDFAFQIDKAGEHDKPKLKLFAHGEAGVLSNPDPHRKRKYVLENGK